MLAMDLGCIFIVIPAAAAAPIQLWSPFAFLIPLVIQIYIQSKSSKSYPRHTKKRHVKERVRKVFYAQFESLLKIHSSCSRTRVEPFGKAARPLLRAFGKLLWMKTARVVVVVGLWTPNFASNSIYSTDCWLAATSKGLAWPYLSNVRIVEFWRCYESMQGRLGFN